MVSRSVIRMARIDWARTRGTPPHESLNAPSHTFGSGPSTGRYTMWTPSGDWVVSFGRDYAPTVSVSIDQRDDEQCCHKSLGPSRCRAELRRRVALCPSVEEL